MPEETNPSPIKVHLTKESIDNGDYENLLNAIDPLSEGVDEGESKTFMIEVTIEHEADETDEETSEEEGE